MSAEISAQRGSARVLARMRGRSAGGEEQSLLSGSGGGRHAPVSAAPSGRRARGRAAAKAAEVLRKVRREEVFMG
jgi:hypothetical protein